MPEKIAHQQVLSSFFSGYKHLDFRKQEIILRADDAPQGVYFIRKGFVRVYVLTGAGNELTVTIYPPGSFFPMTWAMLSEPNVYYFEAMTDVSTYRAPLPDFLLCLRSNMGFMYDINTTVLRSLNRALSRMQYMVLGNATQRVVSVLLMLGSKFGKQKTRAPFISFPVTHQQIATLAAITRESVGAELKKLELSGYIRRKYRQCIIKKPDELRDKFGVDSDGNPVL